jgi:hypothetical protein
MDIDDQIAGFNQAVESASIHLKTLDENVKEFGLARATALAIAQANPDKAAELVSLLAGFLMGIDSQSDGMVTSGGVIAAKLLIRLGSSASTAIPALEHCLTLDGKDDTFVGWLRMMAAEAIWRITRNPAAALAVAWESLGNNDPWLAAHADDLLGELFEERTARCCQLGTPNRPR